jgi:signal transduction histidine kinase
MTIRKTLLITFLMFSIVFAALMTALAYSRARAALSDEIRGNLESQALTVMQQVDAMLFERIKDMQGWRRLDLMQELKVGDIDKRLASFLGDITAAYAGVYTGIYCVQQARVVSASDPALIGTQLPTPPAWITIATTGGAIGVARPDPYASHAVMTLSSAIADAYGEGSLATLSARFNWDEITALLDLATARSGREALLLDADGRALAVSRGLRGQLPRDGLPVPAWRDASAAHGVLTADGARLAMSHLLVGYAHSTSYKGLADLGWTLLILTPERIAFGPVQRLLWSLVALLAAIVAIAALLAIRISARTARPIQSLTAYAREVGRDIDTPAQDIRGPSEIEELNHAFNRTLDELRASRAHLVRASKLAAAGEMAAKLAHEVRTPLGIIRSSAQLINRQPGLDARAHEMMSYMINEVDRINELVTSLLDSARARAPEFHPQLLAEIVRHVLDMLHDKFESRGIVIESVLDELASDLDCDRDQMLQVLLNLLLNASQVLEHGGHIRIAIEAHDQQLALLIDDDGPGIPAAERDTIFEPFVSYRAGGIGLGLPVVREIMSLHGGTISAGTSPLGGARFTLLLPRRRH